MISSVDSSKVRLAVILAAGLGSRLAHRSKVHPKGFVEVGGVPLIERSVRILEKCGIEEILICTGHLGEWYEALARKHGHIRCVKNTEYARSGSLHSLTLLRSFIHEDFLLLESDLLYEERAITALQEIQGDAILICGTTRAGDEVYVEADQEGFLKNLSKDSSKIGSVFGELVGIHRITLKTYQFLCRWEAQSGPKPTPFHYEEGLNRIYPEVKIPFLKIKDLIWTEIDTEEQWERAQQHIFPQLQERQNA